MVVRRRPIPRKKKKPVRRPVPRQVEPVVDDTWPKLVILMDGQKVIFQSPEEWRKSVKARELG